MNHPKSNTTKRSKLLYRTAFCWIVLIVLIAVLAPVIANDKPIMVIKNGTFHFPALSGNEQIITKDESGNEIILDATDIHALSEADAWYLMPPVQFFPNKSDIINSGYKSPGEIQLKKNPDGTYVTREGWERHHLGTGKRGDDLLAGLIHGTRISITTGIFAMLVAGVIGIFLGAIAGYFGDTGLKASRATVICGLIGILPAWFYAFHLRIDILEKSIQVAPWSFWIQLLLSVIIFLLILALFSLAGKLFRKFRIMNHRIDIPADSMISRSIEIFTSIPSLILIITLAAISKPSLVNLIMIIGLTSWTEIARLTRAEMLRMRKADFVEAAKGLAFTEWRILFRHGLPNAISPAMVAISFGIASAILIESGLTFLGIGVPQNMATWGSLLFSGKENFSAWWLVVFPGIVIFLTVTSFNLIGEYLRDKWDPRS